MSKRVNTTKLEIIKTASQMILESGYSNTSVRAICSDLDIGLGHMSFYFATKEHLLAEIVTMLCNFQWKMMREEADDGVSLLLALCLELMTMASAAEEDPVAKDLFISSYTSPLTLEIIRKNDAARAKNVFAEYCPDWTDEQFTEAEVFVSGIEYATLMTTETSSPLDMRISGALDAIMKIYNVPDDIRQKKISKVLSMDYKNLGRRIFKEFKQYINDVNEQAFEELFA